VLKVEPGYLTASMLAPLLKPLAGDPDEGKEEFLAALDRMMPNSTPGLPPKFNRRYNRMLADARIVGALLLLAPTKDRRSKAHKVARTAFAEFETTQEKRVSRGEPAWLLLPFLQGAWQRSTTVPFVDGKQFGFEVTSRTREDAVCCEFLLMITYNVRQFRVCPHCLTLHWRKGTSICEACKREQDRIRKARQKRTPESKFRNKVSQAKRRDRITADQATLIPETLDREGLSSAERLYDSLRLKGRKEIMKNAEEEEGPFNRYSNVQVCLRFASMIYAILARQCFLRKGFTRRLSRSN